MSDTDGAYAGSPKWVRGSGDPVVAALQFTALCQADEHTDLLWGASSTPDPAKLATDVEAAIESWTRCWCLERPTPA